MTLMANFVSLDAFLEELPALAAQHAEQLAGQQCCVALDAKDHGLIAFSIQPDGSIARVDPAQVKPDCTIHASENDLLAVLNGSLKPMIAFLTGRVTVDGNAGVLMNFMKLLA